MVSLQGPQAVVETVQSEACAHCGARGACHALGGEAKRQITALNEVQARPGDRVVMSTPRRGVLGAGFLVYIVPVAVLLAGAVIGQRLGRLWGWDPQGAAAFVGLGSMVLAFWGLSRLSKRMAGRRMLQVRIVRILQKGAVNAVEQCTGSL